MKNIIITTTYDTDTVDAIKLASDLQRNGGGNIILVSVSELSDSITNLLFLSTEGKIDTDKRNVVLESWFAFKKENSFEAISIKEHHQFGMSRPIMENMLQHLEADMVIIPASFQQSKQYIHRQVVKMLYNSKHPVMLLPENTPMVEGIHRALYLDVKGLSLTSTIQNLPYHIIHQSMIDSGEHQPLRNLVDKMNINLIVQPKQKVIDTDEAVAALGLPVLTV